MAILFEIDLDATVKTMADRPDVNHVPTTTDRLPPGVPPTGRKDEIPLVAIVRSVGDKVAHERIYWEQASVQVGLLDPRGGRNDERT
jgi:hypothetical protein